MIAEITDIREINATIATIAPIPAVDRPMFLADWERAVFFHYAVDPQILQPHVPLPLDLCHGRAYVSIVAFTQRHLRPRLGGRLAAILSAPLAAHEFLNLRTYVTHNGIRGIYFLAEWIPNRLALWIGPRLYGLPFRLARNRYAHRHESGDLAGHVSAGHGSFRYHTAVDPCDVFSAAEPGSLDAFLLERYAAYTLRDGKLRLFRIRHEPWPQAAIEPVVTDDSLPRTSASWFRACKLVAANYSPGVHDVRIGPPDLIQPTRQTMRLPAGWLVMTSLIVIATLAGRVLPPWAFMWTLAFCIWAGCKWMTWRRVVLSETSDSRPTGPSSGGSGSRPTGRAGARPSTCQSGLSDAGTTRRRTIAYLLAWPGTDAAAFLDVARRPSRPRLAEWLAALVKLGAGAALLFGIARHFAAHPLAAGWIGMVGTMLTLHFGLFHLLSLAWRHAGVDARPLMNAPLLASGLADFWGRRWNDGFHTLARENVFVPLRRRLGASGATLATFLVSGLIHDAVISLPAGAGFGLPTAYFVLQGAGMRIERRLRLRGRAAGRIFALAWIALPAFGLFHPWFVLRVFVPFLRAIGAL